MPTRKQLDVSLLSKYEYDEAKRCYQFMCRQCNNKCYTNSKMIHRFGGNKPSGFCSRKCYKYYITNDQNQNLSQHRSLDRRSSLALRASLRDRDSYDDIQSKTALVQNLNNLSLAASRPQRGSYPKDLHDAELQLAISQTQPNNINQDLIDLDDGRSAVAIPQGSEQTQSYNAEMIFTNHDTPFSQGNHNQQIITSQSAPDLEVQNLQLLLQNKNLQHRVQTLTNQNIALVKENDMLKETLHKNSYKRPETDREDMTKQTIKENKDQIDSFTDSVLKKILNIPLQPQQSLKLINKQPQVDGFLIVLPKNFKIIKQTPVRRSLHDYETLKQFLQAGYQDMLRNVSIQNRNLNLTLWLQLYDKHSKFDSDLVQFMANCVLRAKQYIQTPNDFGEENLNIEYDETRLSQMDIKLDFRGTFICSNIKVGFEHYKQQLDTFLIKINQENMEKRDNNSSASCVSLVSEAEQEQLDTLCLSELEHDNTKTTTFLQIKMGKKLRYLPHDFNLADHRRTKFVTFYSQKIYSKTVELLQKSNIGQSLGSRFHTLVGSKPFEQIDQEWTQKLCNTQGSGITRNEVKIFFYSDYDPECYLNHSCDMNQFNPEELYDNIDARIRFVKDHTSFIGKLHQNLLSNQYIQKNIYCCPTKTLLTSFTQQRRNLLIIGDKRLTFVYNRNDLPAYITGYTTQVYKWPQFIQFCEEMLKKYACVGAEIQVFHHKGEHLGQIRKSGAALFVPCGVRSFHRGADMPSYFRINPTEEQLDQVNLEGWDQLKQILTEMFTLNPGLNVTPEKKPVGRPRKLKTLILEKRPRGRPNLGITQQLIKRRDKKARQKGGMTEKSITRSQTAAAQQLAIKMRRKALRDQTMTDLEQWVKAQPQRGSLLCPEASWVAMRKDIPIDISGYTKLAQTRVRRINKFMKTTI